MISKNLVIQSQEIAEELKSKIQIKRYMRKNIKDEED